MKDGIVLRMAQHDDFGRIFSLVREIFPKANPTNSEKDVYFLAEKGKDFVGFAHIRASEKSLALAGIGVLPSFQGNGVGGRLLSFAIGWCEREFPEKHIRLKVKPSNLRAISLYLKDGFMLSKDDGGAYSLLRAKMN